MFLNSLHRPGQRLGDRRLLVITALLGLGSLWSEGAIASEPTSSSSIANSTSTSSETVVDSVTATASPKSIAEVSPTTVIAKPTKTVKVTESDHSYPWMTLPVPNDSSTAATVTPPNQPLQLTVSDVPASQAHDLTAVRVVEGLTTAEGLAIPADSSTSAASDPPAQLSQAVTTATTPWRFVLEPYIYLPLETNGDVTIRNIEVPFDFGLGDILESLTFAFYGRFEAWKGPWAIVLDSYYFDTVSSDSGNIPAAALPPGLLPPQITQVPINGTAETAFWKLDIAGAYRFGDANLPNALSTAETDFDLGPFVFDAIAGLRLYSFRNDIELSTPLGFERDFSRSNTFVEPMIGGRARWNFDDNLAAIAAASISGFGLGTDISAEGYAGVDWLFSGNTSLTATYRLTYIDFSEGSTGFNLFQHGPAIGVKFRF